MKAHPLANQRRTSTAVYSQQQLQVQALCERFAHALTPTRESKKVIADANALHQLKTEAPGLYIPAAKALLEVCIKKRKSDPIWPLNETLLQAVLADKDSRQKYLTLLTNMPMISSPQPIEIPMTMEQRSLACFSLSWCLTYLIGKTPIYDAETDDTEQQYWTDFKIEHLLPLLSLPAEHHRLTIRSMRALTTRTCQPLEQAFDAMFHHWVGSSVAFANISKRMAHWVGCTEELVTEQTLQSYEQGKQDVTYDILPTYADIAKAASGVTTNSQLVQWFVQTHQLQDIIDPVFYQRPDDALSWINDKALYSSIGNPKSLVSDHAKNKSFREQLFPDSF